ncbi:MAG: hypothetical protein HN969_13380, partial [Verrucomicrobia bacterium]|nr:hypothetical protein [Verrucomicrobiota bacterium]
TPRRGYDCGTARRSFSHRGTPSVLAIGCGSKPFPWMNDSGFWVINRMSGMTIGETIRSVSFLMTVMAIDGLVAVMLLAWLFPMSG